MSRFGTPPFRRRIKALPLTFVIPGSPKAGTTALAAYLQDRSDVFMCEPKEPYIFGEELAPLRDHLAVLKGRQPSTLFRGVTSSHRAVGEASTLYLSSSDSICQLLQLLPDIKFIVMLRKPVEIAHAFHRQLVNAGFEPESDFERAWSLQDERIADPPPQCPVPRLVQYREIASIGTHLTRLLQLVSTDQVHPIRFETFVGDTASEYRRVLEFLGLEYEGRQEFPAMNEARAPRFPRIQHWLGRSAARKATSFVKLRLPPRTRQAVRVAKNNLLTRRSTRRSLTPAFHGELVQEFSKEVSLLEEALGWDLKEWRK